MKKRGRRPDKARIKAGVYKLYYHVKAHGVLDWTVVQFQDDYIKHDLAFRILKRAEQHGIVKGQPLPPGFDLEDAMVVVGKSLMGGNSIPKQNSQTELPNEHRTSRNPSRVWESGAKNGVGASPASKTKKAKRRRAKGIAKGGARSAYLYTQEFTAAYRAIVVPALKALGYASDDPDQLTREYDKLIRRAVWKGLMVNKKTPEQFAAIVLHMKWRHEQDPTFRNWNKLDWIWDQIRFDQHHGEAMKVPPGCSAEGARIQRERFSRLGR